MVQELQLPLMEPDDGIDSWWVVVLLLVTSPETSGVFSRRKGWQGYFWNAGILEIPEDDAFPLLCAGRAGLLRRD